ncbi:dihydrolipoyl dehydrogenase family protein [Virgisporangium aurantiacum]|uniref:Oxidoreductase n=1 Tax=Virgisporangium aurantiacum TaxID=175570 RepID=A0A8J3YZJ3_9ACTN|nr:NAD(P)/FAD-dependent oxidoreductase [Virgisporangium aurantiacum]GIJ52581.1 oxidoreductase [Virgisporangium aurantiacum]
MSDQWDVIVVGGGPPGENAASYAIQGSGRTAAIVEKELVGGECSYWACMPSKALLRSVEVVDAAGALAGVRGATLDVAGVLKRRDQFTHDHDDSSQVEWARSVGIDVVRGRARITGIKEVTVGERVITANHAVVLATGTTAQIPPVPGLREALPWTSRDATNLHEVPSKVAVIGGGVVACEAAVWLRALGAEVTMLVRGKALLARSEPFASALVAERFAELGIDVRFGVDVERVSRKSPADTGEGRVHGGPVDLVASGETLVVAEVVVAAGRVPATDNLGLDALGLPLRNGFVEVDDHLTVPGHEWLYAVGDVTGRALLTHMGKYQARIAGTVIAARAEGRPLDGPRYRDIADHDMVPQVAFSDPQVASVGLTEAAARSRGIDVETVEYDLGNVAGASLHRDGYKGRAGLVIDRTSDVLVGATFVGPDVAELVHAATIAVVGKVPVSTLWHAVPSYPTVSEIWLRLLEARGEESQ